MTNQILQQIQRTLSSLGFSGQIEDNSYGEQISFIAQKDAKGRDVRITLSYVKGLFEKVPKEVKGKERVIYVWQVLFSYPFKIAPSRELDALHLINMINPRLAMPGFYLKLDDLEVSYTYCLIQMQDQMDQELLMDILGSALNQYDHFLPEFEDFSFNGKK